VKWHNIYPDGHCFFITSTINERIPILTEPGVTEIIVDNFVKSKSLYNFKCYAYVIMPEHWHFLLSFEKGKNCQSFIRDFKRFSAIDIINHLRNRNLIDRLEKFQNHSNGKARYSVWKEQARVLPFYGMDKIRSKLEYIHNNPVKRGLVVAPEKYPLSSARYYIKGQPGIIEIDPFEIGIF
jgi:putative transposase